MSGIWWRSQISRISAKSSSTCILSTSAAWPCFSLPLILITIDRQDHVLKAIRTLLPDPAHYKQAITDFYSFKDRRGVFHATARCWDYIDEDWTFWFSIKDEAPILARLAIRILTTTANSVPSERAFSTMKLQHTKLRNRLVPSRVDKLVFIHINRHILAAGPKAIHQATENEVLQLERDLALLVGEEYLHIDLQKQQEDAPASEAFVDESQSNAVAISPGSDGRIQASQTGKRPASVSFMQRAGLWAHRTLFYGHPGP
jgi:hypothetical protein